MGLGSKCTGVRKAPPPRAGNLKDYRRGGGAAGGPTQLQALRKSIHVTRTTSRSRLGSRTARRPGRADDLLPDGLEAAARARERAAVKARRGLRIQN
jgi:hypothetical protein